MAIAWARGVAANQAAPTEALLRLLSAAGRPAWELVCQGRALPEEVVSAIVGGTEVAQKRLLAKNPHATPDQRGRLAEDPDAMVRCDTAGGPKRGTWLVRPFSDDVVEIFYTAESRHFPPGLVTEIEIVQELEFSGQVRSDYRVSLVAHPDPAKRVVATWSWTQLTAEQQAALRADPEPVVREAVDDRLRWLDPVANEARLPDHWTHARTYLMMHLPMTHDVAEREFSDEDGRVTMAHNPYTPPDIVERLAQDPDPVIRTKIATRFDLPAGIRAQLASDPDQDVRTAAVAFSAAPTESQHLAVIRNMFGGSFVPAAFHLDSSLDVGDPDWYVRAAESDNVLLRRAAARDVRLPMPQVRRLAADPDREVRSLLAHSHSGAPPELMIEVFVAEPKNRAVLMHRPQMPRTGLAHLLDHPDPQVRALAAADRTLPQPPVAQLDDEDELVRRTAAANPLLPLEMVERLLQDPCHAEGAAANPGLDGEALHGLLDAAGIPR